MNNEPVNPPLWVAAGGKIKDDKRRQAVLRAVEQNLPRIVAYSKVNLGGAVDHAMVLDQVVDAALNAETKEPVRDYGPYLFKSFVRKARRLLRRANKVEYLDTEQLAALKGASNTSVVEDLDRQIQIEEAIELMDEQTRTIYVMRSQGYSRREVGEALGMSEEAVRKHFARGIEKVRRLIRDRQDNEGKPKD